MSDKIVLTGTAGFIGFHVARTLLDAGKSVIGIDNLCETYYPRLLKDARLGLLNDHSAYEHLDLDLADAGSVGAIDKAVSECSSVIHLAAQACVPWSFPNARQCLHDNVMGFQALLDSYEKHELDNFVYASSSSVYGRSPDLSPLVEDKVTNRPVSPYGSSKIANEMMAQASYSITGRPITGLRFFKVYGPWARPDTVFFKFVDNIYRGKPVEIRNFGDIEHSFTYIEDVVQGVLAALDQPADTSLDLHPRYNLGNPQTDSLSTAVDIMESLLGRKAERLLTPLPPGDRSHSRADVSAAGRDLGFQPSTPVSTGLAGFVNWYLEDYVPLAGVTTSG